MSQAHKKIADAPKEQLQSPTADLARLEDLELELQTLGKSGRRLLVQRRKLQARLKSYFKTLLRAVPDLERKLAQRIERDLAHAEENALHIEIWLPEYEQIGSAVLATSRDLQLKLEELLQEAGKARGDATRLAEHVGTLEADRIARERQLEKYISANVRLRADCAALEDRVASMAKALNAARNRTPSGSPSADMHERLRELQAQYETLLKVHDKDRQDHAREAASLTKQLTDARIRYEAGLVEAARRYEALATEAARAERAAPRSGRDAGPGPARIPTHPVSVDARTRPDQAVAHGKQRKGERDQVVILDDERVTLDAVADLVQGGYPVTTFAPHPDLVHQLPSGSLGCIALNLALPNAWTTLRKLRGPEGKFPAPLIAYALAHPTTRGFWFGPVDFIVLPLTKAALGSALDGTGANFKQAIIIGSDDAVADEVRQQLVRERVSCAHARDRAQALDALKAVYPHVAFVHPGAAPVDAFRAVAAIRNVSLFQRLPLIFFLDPRAQPHEEALFSAAVRTILRLGSLQPADLAESLAAVFQRYVRRPQ